MVVMSVTGAVMIRAITEGTISEIAETEITITMAETVTIRMF
jgi:hypothetical protein